MVERRAACRAGRLLRAKKDERVGKRHDVDAAELHGRPAERVDPELLLRVDARDVQVIVTDADRRVRMADELRKGNR